MKSTHIVIAVLFIAGCVMNGCTKDKLPTEASIPDRPRPRPAREFSRRILMDHLGRPRTSLAFHPEHQRTVETSYISAGSGPSSETPRSAETIDLIIDLSASKAYIVPGTYALGTIPAQEGEAQHSDGLLCVCHTNSAHSGTVTITALDVARKVVSGSICVQRYWSRWANAHFQ